MSLTLRMIASKEQIMTGIVVIMKDFALISPFFSNLVLCVATLRVIASKEPVMTSIVAVMKGKQIRAVEMRDLFYK